MDFGDVLDASFQIFRRAFWQLALAQAIVAVPVALIQLLLQGGGDTTTASLTLAIVQRNLPFTLLTGLLGLVQAGAVAALAQQAAMGKPMHVGDAYGLALKRLPWLVGYGVLAGLMVAVGTVIFVVPGVIAAIYVAPAFFLVALTGEGVFSALGHGFRLVQGYFWRVFGVALLTGVLIFVVNLFASLIVTVATNPHQDPHVAAVSVSIVSTLISIFLSSFPLVALYMQYVDLRVRRGESVGD